MIFRKVQPPVSRRSTDEAPGHGEQLRAALSDQGGLSQFGVFEESLMPGASSSDRH